MNPVREIDTINDFVASYCNIELELELADGSNKDIYPVIDSKPINFTAKVNSLIRHNIDQKIRSTLMLENTQEFPKHEQIISYAVLLLKNLAHGVYSRSKIIERTEELEKFSTLYDNLHLIANAYLASTIDPTDDSIQRYNSFITDLVEELYTEMKVNKSNDARVSNSSLVNFKDLAGNANNCKELAEDLGPLETKQLVFIDELNRVCQKQNINDHKFEVDKHY